MPPRRTAATPTNEQFAVGRVEKLIWDRLRNGDSCADLVLKGWVYQFWRKEPHNCPTVAKLAELIGISRSKFYRSGYLALEIKTLYNQLCAAARNDPQSWEQQSSNIDSESRSTDSPE